MSSCGKGSTKSDKKALSYSFSDKTFAYDGREHKITIDGTLLKGVSVAYSNNKLTNKGSILATATFYSNDDETQIQAMTAKLTIIDLEYKLNSDNNSYCIVNCGTIVKGIFFIPSMHEDKSVTEIGQSAFSGCSGLTIVDIPDSVTKIGNDAFMGCSSLTSITIPNSVTMIGDRAFSGCSSLTSINIPDSVTYIGWYVFDGCSSLKTINFDGTINQWNMIYDNSSFFNSLPAGCTIVCTDGTITK